MVGHSLIQEINLANPEIMAIKFSLFHSRISVPALTFYSPPRSAAKPLLSYALCFSTVPYGPSLRKGHSLQLKNGPCSTDNSITSLDEAAFTRVFDISALRVPSEICSTLENRLRGHLLNWPRINNIARVPGDEIDDQITGILPQSEAEAVVTLNRRIYGQAEGDGEPLNAVLYRDKLATTFNSQGYSRFRNLAKISRPKKKKRRDGGEKRQTKGVGRNEVALVEVVEDDDDGEDMSGLLGEDFGPRAKWRGSTRLLLLDEQYANKRIEDLPEAIKVVFREHDGQWTKSAFELVKCKLTLFYDYWQLNEVLEALLPKGMIVPSAFETVGHIAHLNLRDEHLQYKNLIAKVVLDKNKPKIQTVVNKIVAIHNDYRTMQLEVLAGNNSLVTTVVENGLRFHVDLAKVYWNSRLATERQRLLSCFTHSDVVCDVFAGVGPIAISAAKKVKYVYANDLNPCAVEYLEKNCVLNKLERKIEVFNMDGRRFIQSVFASQKTKPITQVVMNLPKDAVEFLDALRGVFHGVHLDKDCTLPRIHVYGFSKAEDPEFDFHERIRIALAQVGFDVEMHKVRLVAPGKWMLCASFVLPEKVAFFRPVSQFSTRRSVMLMPILFSTQSIATKSAAAFDFRMTVPDQSLQEAESAIQSHVQSLLKVKDLLMSESWKEAQKLLRKSSSLLKQDIYTIIQNKSAGERPRLRKLYSDLFNGVTRLDYAARDKDRVRVWECYDGIVSSLQDILSRI